MARVREAPSRPATHGDRGSADRRRPSSRQLGRREIGYERIAKVLGAPQQDIEAPSRDGGDLVRREEREARPVSTSAAVDEHGGLPAQERLEGSAAQREFQLSREPRAHLVDIPARHLERGAQAQDAQMVVRRLVNERRARAEAGSVERSSGREERHHPRRGGSEPGRPAAGCRSRFRPDPRVKAPLQRAGRRRRAACPSSASSTRRWVSAGH